MESVAPTKAKIFHILHHTAKFREATFDIHTVTIKTVDEPSYIITNYPTAGAAYQRGRMRKEIAEGGG